MNSDTDTQAAEEMYDRYVQAWELAGMYRPIIAEFTTGRPCTHCLGNAIMGLLYDGQAVNANTVLIAYRNEVHA